MFYMKPFLTTLCVSAALLTGPSAAFAQFASDSSAPIAMASDDSSLENGIFTLTGQVDIRQGDVRLLADRVQFYTQGGGSDAGLFSTSDFSRMVATGNFYYITPDQEVRGDRAVYTSANESFVVTGDVVLLQDDSVVTGKQLDYNLQTREAKVGGTCKGRKCGKGQRVSILIRSTDSPQGAN